MKAFRRQVDECHPLIPGYTGYIPFRFYRIGSSFGNDSVWCVNAFRDATQRKTDQANELRCLAATAPQLPPLCSNEDIINVLDDYNYKRHPNVLGPVETRRGLLEPPMPGWTGFVPRSKVTEHGHGVRYHVMAENCYKDFKDCLDRVSHEHPAKEPVDVHVPKPKELRPHQRFYRPEGMLPKYTGHIPHERSGIGKTFGNVCRSCSVCNHPDVNYGAYLAKKRKAEKLQEQIKEDKKDLTA
ncbi:uncharacterized protein C10orf82 homolog [Varanus komodoensis]|uniref:uncharacterized protein C10orf82 homolog n=1 Tax=Varanus komodoensis TaxID=61221 RepID=UPI001CF7A2E0|nr:uncharacterized protein C10orf82 homolog [Varanus komodoensis]